MTTAPGLWSPEFFADPAGFYDRLRERDPVSWDEEQQTWLVTRYDDVAKLLRTPAEFSSRLSALDDRPVRPAVRPQDLAAAETVAGYRIREFIQLDPPLARVKRAPVAARFAPRSLEALRVGVREVIEDLLDDLAGAGGAGDLRERVARPLPMRVISQLMGVPPGQEKDIAEQARKRMASVLSLDEDRMVTSVEGFAETVDHLTGLLDAAAAEGRDDVVGDLARAEGSGAYSREESLANALLLIDAGHETTVQLICNGTLALLSHPDQWAALVADPEGRAQRATEECLRYDPPLHAFRRIAAVDTELGGRAVRAGDRVMGVIVAANRDPRTFPDPTRFDIAREPNAHLSFGLGAHFCLGQYLARVEGQEFLKALATRFPDLSLAPGREVTYVSTPRVRSMTALPVQWARAA